MRMAVFQYKNSIGDNEKMAVCPGGNLMLQTCNLGVNVYTGNTVVIAKDADFDDMVAEINDAMIDLTIINEQVHLTMGHSEGLMDKLQTMTDQEMKKQSDLAQKSSTKVDTVDEG